MSLVLHCSVDSSLSCDFLSGNKENFVQYNINTANGQANSPTLLGGNVTTGLYLTNDPVSALEAATKRYVDGKISTIPASSVVSGVMPIGRFPAYGGDIVSAAGSNVLTLKSSGVTTGTYPKVSVTAKGIVTQGMVLTADDVPNLSWISVSLDRPTTLIGFGVTDALSKTGGTMTGFISVMNAPSQTLHAANKNYVDNYSVSSGGTLTVGTIVRMPQTTTPSGYLRCNGALLSKTAYPELYAIFGDNVVTQYGAAPGSGKPWEQQYGINDVQSGDITGWVGSTSAPNAVGAGQVVVTKNRAYFIGGYKSGLLPVSAVYTATINPDGTIGGWTAGPSLPSTMQWGQAIATKNRVYAIGAGDGDLVYTSVVNTDGTLAGWTTATALPVRMAMAQAIVTKSYVYVMGGTNYTDSISTVCTAPINTDGTLGGWTYAASLPGPLNASRAVVTKNRVYLLGGATGSYYVSTVYTAPINSDGTLGAWATGTPLPINVGFSQTCVTTNRVYLMGGGNSDTVFSSVYSAPINADGTIGTWVAGTSLPFALGDATVAVTQSRVHIINGADTAFATTPVSISAPFSGGLNDYSTFYTSGYTLTDPDNFQLPDYASLESSDFKYYIKY